MFARQTVAKLVSLTYSWRRGRLLLPLLPAAAAAAMLAGGARAVLVAAPLRVEAARVCHTNVADCIPLAADTPARFCCMRYYGTDLNILVRGALGTRATTVLRLDGVEQGTGGSLSGANPERWRIFRLGGINHPSYPGTPPDQLTKLHAGVYVVDLLDKGTGATALVGTLTVANPPPAPASVRIAATAGGPARGGQEFGIHIAGVSVGGIVYWDGAPLPFSCEFGQGSFGLVPAQLATSGDHALQVMTPAPGGGESAIFNVHVEDAAAAAAPADFSRTCNPLIG